MHQIAMAEAWDAGVAHLDAERFVAAQTVFSHMLRLWPDHAPIRHALCLIARRTDDPAAALQHAEAAIGLAPKVAANHVMRARVLAGLGRWQEVEAAFRAAAACPDAAATLWQELLATLEQVGIALGAAHDLEAAEACLRRLAALDPTRAAAPFHLGRVLHQREEYDGAAAAFRATLRLAPDHHDARNNLGSTLMELGDIPAAESCLRQACHDRPDQAAPHNNLGSVLRRAGQLAPAEACFVTALALAPDHAEARCNLATTQLLTGRFTEGWQNLEARWRTGEVKNRPFPQPRWQGEKLPAGQVLLLHAEQGFGDTLQFCRFVPLAAVLADIVLPDIVLEVPQPLKRLLARAFPQVRVTAAGETLPPFTTHCPLMSLPLALGLTPTQLGGQDPYLSADPAASADWHRRLAALPGRRVGLVWQGNQRIASMRRRRDLPASALTALGDIPDLSFVSLQKTPAGPRPELPLHDWTGELTDLADTAALIQQLDLVIGVDTAVIHLAAALGRPTWLLNRFDTCWRWRDLGDDSAWYATLRQFRQPASGNWNAVMDGVVRALVALQRT